MSLTSPIDVGPFREATFTTTGSVSVSGVVSSGFSGVSPPF